MEKRVAKQRAIKFHREDNGGTIMIITIELEYIMFGEVTLQRASFKADDFEFHVEPEKEAARVAFNWFQQINNKTPFISGIKKVVCNEMLDITDLVNAKWKDETKKAFEQWRAPWKK